MPTDPSTRRPPYVPPPAPVVLTPQQRRKLRWRALEEHAGNVAAAVVVGVLILVYVLWKLGVFRDLLLGGDGG